ncbi:MAG: Na+/H+ antiporter subunit G [Gammaproteobacteria bacterium]|nr:Na+/H+ antiporter subunit G [Gammaproteobacteria bacterium]
MSPILEALIAGMLLTGGTFALIGSFGLAKLSDFYKRLHGPTKATTLGVGGVLIASSLFVTATTGELSAHEFLISLFLFMTAPVSAHLLVKASLRLEAQARAASSPAPADDRPRSGETTSP